MLLHVFRHVDAHHRAARRRTGIRRAPWSARSCRRRSGPRNRNEPIGRFGSCRPARARRTALATATIASSWPMTRLAQRLFHLQQLLALALEHLVDRNAGPARDHAGDVLRRSTTSFSMRCSAAVLGFLQLALEVGDDGVGDLAGARRSRRGAAPAPARCGPGRASPSASAPRRASPSRPCHCVVSSADCASSSAELRRAASSGAPSRRHRSPSSAPRARSSAG